MEAPTDWNDPPLVSTKDCSHTWQQVGFFILGFDGLTMLDIVVRKCTYIYIIVYMIIYLYIYIYNYIIYIYTNICCIHCIILYNTIPFRLSLYGIWAWKIMKSGGTWYLEWSWVAAWLQWRDGNIHWAIGDGEKCWVKAATLLFFLRLQYYI